jgi:cell division septum initiation protein DivIVA
MQDYIKELEQQNERLKESLAHYDMMCQEYREQIIDFESMLPVWYDDTIDRKVGRKNEKKVCSDLWRTRCHISYWLD